MVTKDAWLELVSVNELMQALDILVSAWACFWEGDHSMVTLRYTVTKLKEFPAITKQDVRLKLLEAFIDKILKINQWKAAQQDPPLKAKEVYEIGKE